MKQFPSYDNYTPEALNCFNSIANLINLLQKLTGQRYSWSLLSFMEAVQRIHEK